MAISREVIAVFTRTGIALVNMVFGVLGPGHKASLTLPLYQITLSFRDAVVLIYNVLHKNLKCPVFLFSILLPC